MKEVLRGLNEVVKEVCSLSEDVRREAREIANSWKRFYEVEKIGDRLKECVVSISKSKEITIEDEIIEYLKKVDFSSSCLEDVKQKILQGEKIRVTLSISSDRYIAIYIGNKELFMFGRHYSSAVESMQILLLSKNVRDAIIELIDLVIEEIEELRPLVCSLEKISKMMRKYTLPKEMGVIVND